MGLGIPATDVHCLRSCPGSICLSGVGRSKWGHPGISLQLNIWVKTGRCVTLPAVTTAVWCWMKEPCLILRYSQLSSTCTPREFESLPFWRVRVRMPCELHVHLKVVFCCVGSTALDTHTLLSGECLHYWCMGLSDLSAGNRGARSKAWNGGVFSSWCKMRYLLEGQNSFLPKGDCPFKSYENDAYWVLTRHEILKYYLLDQLALLAGK